MATELGKAYVQIMPSAKGISGSISKELSGEATSAGKVAGNNIVGSIKKIIVAAGIGKALASTIMEGGALQQSIGGVETLFKDNADKVRKYANEAYKTVGVSANEYMENVTSFSASLLQSMGGDTEKAAEVANMAMIDMGDNANKMGTDMRDIQNAYQGFAKQNYTMLDNLKLGYGGTKTEMQRLLADATKLSGVEYNIDNLDDVYNAIHVIQKEIGITGTTALEAEETIQGSFNAMKSAFTNVLGALAIGENLSGALKGLAETVATFLFDNLLPMLGNIISALPGAIITFIQAAGPAFMESGGELISSIANGLVTGIPAFFESMAEFMGQVVTWIKEQLPLILQEGIAFITEFASGIFEGAPSVIENIGEILSNLLVAIFDFIPLVLESGMELISNLAKGIWDNLPAIIESITNVLGKLLDTIVEKYPEYLKKGIEIISNIAKGIWNNLPEIIKTIGDLLIKVIGAIRERLPEFLQKGIELIAQLALGIVKSIPGIVAKVPEVIFALVKAFGSLIGQFVGIGADIVKGLWEGIKSVKNWILDKIKGFVGDITSGIKSFFGINSPSKVMADEVGKWLPLGLAEGIEDNINPVSRAMELLGEEASFSSNLSYSLPRWDFNDTSNQIDTAGPDTDKDINLHLTVQYGEDTVAQKVINSINRQNRISGKTVIKV
jgi:phage-related protein